MKKENALIVVDVQNDFCPDGALAISKGDTIIKTLNKYIGVFKNKRWPVIATRDWHPEETKHFKAFGGLWPVHCVERTKGARFHPKLSLPSNVKVVSKGMNPNEDGYSAFDARDFRNNKLPRLLRNMGVKKIFIGGLATDYCVKATSLSAIKDNFKVYVLKDAIKGVDAKASREAIALMKEKGIALIDYHKFQAIADKLV